MKNRQILDGLLATNEPIDSWKRSRKVRVLFEIDMEKAYDHVELSFLDHTLGPLVLAVNGELELKFGNSFLVILSQFL